MPLFHMFLFKIANIPCEILSHLAKIAKLSTNMELT